MATEGWDLEGIPRPWWPYVRDLLVARDLYRLSTLVSEPEIGKRLAGTAEQLMVQGAKCLSAPAKVVAKPKAVAR